MSLRTLVKRTIFGRPGVRERTVRLGLLRGLRFNLDAAHQSQVLAGMYERELNKPMRDYAGRASVVLEIGASDGYYAVYFASRPNVQRVVAFEGYAPTLERFRANVLLNDPAYTRKLVVVDKYVGNRDEGQWCSVDRALPEYAAGIAGPVLLKIDIEGGELDALKGAEQTLRTRECLLIVETHSEKLERDCLELLRGLGYRCDVIDVGWLHKLIPEQRGTAHNRWFVASKPA
jgi:hypothetical protein